MSVNCSTVVLLLLLTCVTIATGQRVSCPVNCVCLVPVLTSCDNPIQQLGGLGSSLPEIVPGSFSQASFVTDLRLDHNAPLVLHSDSFVGLTNISTLDLSDNAISSLPDGVFSSMPTLLSLNLSNNRLTSLNPRAFTGLVQLTTLILSGNQLTNIPVDELTTALPQLSSISLGANPIDCNSQNIGSLVRLVRSGLIANGNQLSCSNGTLVISLNVTIPTTTVSMATTPTPFPSVTMATTPIASLISTIRPTRVQRTTSVIGISTNIALSFTSFESSSMMLKATPTPNVSVLCIGETTLLSSGYFDWSDTLTLKEATQACPHGPTGNVARRNCMVSGQWGSVDDSECNDGSEATQLLASISAIPVSAEDSVLVSAQLATLPSTSLSVQELNTIFEVAGELLNVSGTNTQVLQNTLETFNTIFKSSSETLGTLNTQTTNSIRQLIDSALLNALSADNPQLAISYSHLAVGGAYLPATNHTLLLAVIKVSNESIGLEVGGVRRDDNDVIVEVSEGPTRVQVTVYEQDELFNQSNCSNYTIDAMRVAPIISVVNEGGSNSANETVVLSYRRLMSSSGVTYLCVRWSPLTSKGCNGTTGRWVSDGCMLVLTEDNDLQCQCFHQGTFTLLTIPSESTTVSVHSTVPGGNDESVLSLSARIIFYSLCTLAVLLFITIFITILAHSTLRSSPILQLIVNLALSQALTSLLMMLSFEVTSSRWTCYALGVMLQYIILVSLSWMGCLPLIVCVQVFKRLWYEKTWITAPILMLCWVWPVIPVVVYNGLRYSTFPEQPTICWLESVVFPNTITYVCAFVCLVVMATILIVLLVLICSNCTSYELESSTYYQPLGILVNFVLYTAVVIFQFFTAASAQFNINPFYFLLVIGGLMIISAVYFFTIYGIIQSKVRQALLCSHCELPKATPTNTDHTSRRTNQSSYRMKARRSPTRIADEMNINYVDDYLGSPHHVPVPMVMLNQVQRGRVIRRTNDPMNSHMHSGVIIHNPMYRMSLTSDP